MNREELIACAIEYQGDYSKVAQAFYNNHPVKSNAYADAITILDEDYPILLKDLTNPPLVMFYKGHRELLKGNKVAVVGSRKPCDYAIYATKKLVNLLAPSATIVSGLAKGIDACAHKSALGFKTIGILGCGIENIYPKENKDLYIEMSANQLIISEYPGNVLPLAYHFPFRNRIIAGLSQELYVMQASLKSGTLITVNEMLNLNRDVYALPYEAFDINGIGTNRLIDEGANMILMERFLQR